MEKVVISNPVRTAIGGFGGILQDIPAVDLGVRVVNEILSRTGIDPKEVDDCILGNVLGAGLGQNPSRQVAVKSGLGTETPGITLNRVCGSGLQSIAFAAQAIKAGDSNAVLAGGIENMSQTPFYLTKARYGYRMAMPKDEIVDGMVHDGLWDIFNDYHMGVTAENLAEAYNLSKEVQDEFAYKSQMKTKAAQEAGKFNDEIVTVSVPQRRKDPLDFNVDEHPRGDVTPQSLAGMRPVFKMGGTVTAGNASGINDGAAAVLVSSESKAKELGLQPFASIVSYAVGAVDPSIMGIGPVPAITKALHKANLSLNDIDLFELNEAFAAQSLAVLSDLPIPEEKINVNGGAIALGHPIGASGTVILVKLLHEMRRRPSVKRGLAALCIGGGMGIAMIVEKIGGTSAASTGRRGRPKGSGVKAKPGPKPGAKKRGPGRPKKRGRGRPRKS
ncbi:MAG: acetyl-CoA C-acyltransferase [Candidatus Mycalebacterium zealandia]|nr:MAG: acetyl-CoA C-acyltransferase [Candidatus Mycalebacterium zealandia]